MIFVLMLITFIDTGISKDAAPMIRVALRAALHLLLNLPPNLMSMMSNVSWAALLKTRAWTSSKKMIPMRLELIPPSVRCKISLTECEWAGQAGD